MNTQKHEFAAIIKMITTTISDVTISHYKGTACLHNLDLVNVVEICGDMSLAIVTSWTW